MEIEEGGGGVLVTGHGKDASGHDGQPALETVRERFRVPVPEADRFVVRRATGGDDYHRDDDDEDPAKLDAAAYHLHLAEDRNGPDVDQDDDREEDRDPSGGRHAVRPEAEDRHDTLMQSAFIRGGA